MIGRERACDQGFHLALFARVFEYRPVPQFEIPPGSTEIPTFEFVLLSTAGVNRYPALLECWYLLPDGRWACRIRIPGNKSGRSRGSVAYTMLFDPERIQLMEKLSIVGNE